MGLFNYIGSCITYRVRWAQKSLFNLFSCRIQNRKTLAFAWVAPKSKGGDNTNTCENKQKKNHIYDIGTQFIERVMSSLINSIICYNMMGAIYYHVPMRSETKLQRSKMKLSWSSLISVANTNAIWIWTELTFLSSFATKPRFTWA
jgi:hypothetical protein